MVYDFLFYCYSLFVVWLCLQAARQNASKKRGHSWDLSRLHPICYSVFLPGIYFVLVVSVWVVCAFLR